MGRLVLEGGPPEREDVRTLLGRLGTHLSLSSLFVFLSKFHVLPGYLFMMCNVHE
jgi:hypothetical protein